MFDDGLLKVGAGGKYEAVVDASESEQIRSESSMSKKRASMPAADADLASVHLENIDDDVSKYAME